MKRYRLEDLKNEKLITSCDVQFFKDEISSKLAIVDINKLDMPFCWVDKLVNNTLHKDDSILLVLIPADIINKSTSENKVHTIPIFQVLNRKVTNQLLTVFKKSTK